ncbi:MAG: hypothetical protein D6769_01390, partial [Methanobacteriota archaeon]
MEEQSIKNKLEEWNAFISGIGEGKDVPSFDGCTIPLKEMLEKSLDEFRQKKDRNSLKRCTLILKHWYSKRDVLSSILQKAKNKESISSIINKGKVEEELEEPQEVSIMLKTLGINHTYDGKIRPTEPYKVIDNGSSLLFLEPSKARELEELDKELDKVGSRIQVLNAQRQIRELSEEDEKNYEDLQKKYIELSKKREIILQQKTSPNS